MYAYVHSYTDNSDSKYIQAIVAVQEVNKQWLLIKRDGTVVTIPKANNKLHVQGF